MVTTVAASTQAANPGATASFPQGSATTWQGDRVTYLSSRGPGGDWPKPDVTAPGLHILAANTLTPEAPDGGPPGNLFQAIAGTSMSAPHTGAAALVRRSAQRGLRARSSRRSRRPRSSSA